MSARTPAPVPEFCRGTPAACLGHYWEFARSARTCLGIGALDTALIFLEALRLGGQHWPEAVARRARAASAELDEAFAQVALSAAFVPTRHEVA